MTHRLDTRLDGISHYTVGHRRFAANEYLQALQAARDYWCTVITHYRCSCGSEHPLG